MAEDRFRVEMDGEWDIDDLGALTSSLRLAYAYFYWITKQPIRVDPIIRSKIVRDLWSGESWGDRFAHTLYTRIKHEDRLRVGAIRFESPGFMEVVGLLGVMLLLARVVRAWIGAGSDVVELFKKVEDYFDRRKLRRIKPNVSLDDIDGQAVDEARALCFEYGRALGLHQAQIEQVIELAGNPISGLRLLVVISSEARRLHQLEQQGKIALPRK
jgi:hypothetical protein